MATSKSSMVTLLGNLFPVYGSLILGLFLFWLLHCFHWKMDILYMYNALLFSHHLMESMLILLPISCKQNIYNYRCARISVVGYKCFGCMSRNGIVGSYSSSISSLLRNLQNYCKFTLPPSVYKYSPFPMHISIFFLDLHFWFWPFWFVVGDCLLFHQLPRPK